MSGELNDYINKQRAKGVTDEKIRETLIATGWDSGKVASALSQTEPDAPPLPPITNEPKASTSGEKQSASQARLSASQVLLLLGLLFIVIAAAVIIFGSWETLSPFARFLVVALPNLILLIIGGSVRNKPNLQHVEEGTTSIGLMLLPITFGTMYYQFSYITEVGFYLFLLATLTALPVVLIYDFWQKRRSVSVVTITFLVFAFISLGAYTEWEAQTWYLVGAVLGAASLATSVVMNRKGDVVRFDQYQITSAILLILFIPAVAAQELGVFNSNLDATTWVTFALVGGTAMLFVASLYAWLFPQRTEREVSIQRALQFVSMICYLLPLVILISDESVYVLLALVMAVLLTVLGLKTNVTLIFNAGVTGVVASLLVVLFKEVTDIKTPILLFVLGFVAIGISIFLGKIKFARQGFYSESLTKSLGIVSDEEQMALSSASHRSVPPKSLSIGRVILYIFLAYIFFWFIRPLAFGIF